MLLNRACLLLFLNFFVKTVAALHASEAGVIDWHKPHIGVPLTFSQSLSPRFHRYSTGHNKLSTRSVILTATNANVLAALNPTDGSIVWRHIYNDDDPIVSFQALGEVVIVLSGPGGSTFRSFSSSKGELISEVRLHNPLEEKLFDPVDLGVHVAFLDTNDTSPVPNPDVFVLNDGHVVRRIDSTNGKARWEWKAEDQTSSIVYSRIARTKDALFVIGLQKSFASYIIHVVSLSASTGEVTASKSIPSSIHNGLTDFLLLSDTSSENSIPHIVWLEPMSHGKTASEAKTLKYVALTPKLDEKPKHIDKVPYREIRNIGLNEQGHFVGILESGLGRSLRITGNGVKGIQLLWEFAESETSSTRSDSIYSGGLDKDGNPYVGRVFWSHNLGLANGHLFAPHEGGGKGLIRGITFPFQTDKHGIVNHVAIDAANPKQHLILGRFVVTTTSGAIQCWTFDKLLWTREEGLSEIKAAEFVELPEQKAVLSFVREEREGFVGRLTRHISDAKGLPTYLINFIKRFATGSYASVSSSAAVTSSNVTLSRDAFGFRSLIIAASARGVLYAIDSANGDIVWSRLLGLGWAVEVGGRHVPLKVYVTKTVADDSDGREGKGPEVVVVTQRFADNGLIDTVLFHVDALTGEDLLGKSGSKDLLQGIDIIAGEVVGTFFYNGPPKAVVLVDNYLQIHLYPNTPDIISHFEEFAASKIQFPLLADNRLLGHRVNPAIESTGKFVAYNTWTLAFPASDVILSRFTRPSAIEPIASYGKVLGDRTTLYKYLSPSLIGVTTMSPPSTTDGKPICNIYLIEGGKGTILYHASVPSINGVCDIKATLTENWLVYIYYDDEVVSAPQAKGYKVVSVELYEGKKGDDKTRSSEASSFSNRSADVHFLEQSFVFPISVYAVATTSTKFGIATKDIIVANGRDQIQTFSRRMLDPRRPKRKPTAAEQEEWLVQYDPVIPDDPRRIISHNYQVAKIEKIVTAPAFLESTSLIFAYGLDFFFSRVAPSNTFDVLSENFNKAQLVLIIAALGSAIFVTRPMVRRKKLRERWYPTQ